MSFHPATLSRLWALTGQALPDDGQEAFNSHFDAIGLNLSWPLKPSGYGWCAPSNVLQFAQTGGDGVHFGLLLLDDMLSEDSPVVMTIPMSLHENDTNFVVGENLRDFLALGCRRGYFFLDGLAHARESLLNELADTEFGETVCEEQRILLTNMSQSFNLKPWGARVEERLKWLKDEFHSFLAPPAAP